MPKPLETLYQSLKANNYDVPSTYESFERTLTAPGNEGVRNRQTLYQSLRRNNYDVPDTYESFSRTLFAPVKPQSTGQGSRLSQMPADVEERRMRTARAPKPLDKSKAARQLRQQQQAIQDQQARWQQQGLRQKKYIQQRTKNLPGGMERVEDRAQEYLATGEAKPTALAPDKDIVRGDLEFNPESGRMEQSYMAPDGSSYFDRNTAEADYAYNTLPEDEIELLEREQELIGMGILRRGRELDEEYEAQSWWEKMLDAMSADYESDMGPHQRRVHNDEEMQNLLAASRKNRDALRILRDKRDNNMNGFWHTFGTTVANGYTFTGGRAEMNDAAAIMKSAQRMDEIQRKLQSGEKLTNVENAALSLAQNTAWDNAIQAMYGDDYGAWATAGGAAVTSLEMMPEFIAGMPALRGLGSMGIKLLTRNSVKGLGRYMLKGLGATLGTMAGGAVMANTIQAERTFGKAASNAAGSWWFGDDGEFVLGHYEGNQFVSGGESLGAAIFHAEQEAIPEAASEGMGEFLPGGGKVITDALKRIGLSRIAKPLASLSGKSWYQNYQRFLNAAGWHGVGGEAFEEYIGTLDGLLLGDLEGVKKLADLRTHYDIWLSCATLGPLLNTPMVIASSSRAVYSPVAYHRIKSALTKQDKIAALSLTEDKWGQWRDRIDGTPSEQMADLMVEIRDDNDLAPQEKKAVFDYIKALQQYRGWNLGEYIFGKDAEENGDGKTEEEQERSQQYADGYNAVDLGDGLESVGQRLRDAGMQLESYGFTEGDTESLDHGNYSASWLASLDEDRRGAVLEYINARAAYDGSVQRAQDDINSEIAVSDAMVDRQTNRQSGTLIKASHRSMGEVYITDGEITLTADNEIDLENSDRDIIVFDPRTGELGMATIGDITGVEEPVDAEELKAQNAEAIRQEVANRRANQLEGKVAKGGTYTWVDAQNGEHTFTVLEDDLNGTLQVMVDNDPNQVTDMPRDDVQTLVDSYKAQQAAAGAAAQDNPVEETDGTEETGSMNYQLSDEVDENGRQFVLNSEGDIAFGQIGAETGLTPAPILLSEGVITNPNTNAGYGLVHIEARHGDQIRAAGYKSVLDFIEEVARNYEVIRKGNDRDGRETYMLQLTDKHNNTLMVELSGDGTYWNINTAGIFKTSYGANRTVVYNRHTTANQSAETGGASLSGEQSGTTPSTRMVAPTQSMPSGGKGSTENPNLQGNGGENASDARRTYDSLVQKYGEKVGHKLEVTVADKTAELEKAKKALAKAQQAYDDAPIGKEEKAETKLAAAQAVYDAALADKQVWDAVKAEHDKEQMDIVREQAERRAAEDAAARQAAIEAEAQYQAEQEAKRQEEAERGPFTPGHAVTDKWAAASKTDGVRDQITLADGTQIQGHYVLAEAGAATPSHDPTTGWKPSEGFPFNENGGTVNDRDYERDQAAQDITQRMSETYDSRAAQSVPVVTSDGVVLSGNGRTIAGDLAAKSNTDGAYIDYLKEYGGKYGFNAEQVGALQHPRVLFVPDETMPYTPETFARFNAQEMKGQNLTETAVKLGKTVDNATFNDVVGMINRFDTMTDFYADESAPTQAINRLLRGGVINPMQFAQMFDGDKVSGQGKEMLENLLLGKAFEGNPEAIRQLTEMPSVRQQIVSSLAEIANNSALGDYSLEDAIAQSIGLVYSARKGGIKQGDTVANYARQMSLFPSETGTTVADYRNAMVLILGDILNGKAKNTLKYILTLYNRNAADAASGQMDLFSGAVKTPEEILKETIDFINQSSKNELKREIKQATGERKAAASGEQSSGDQEGGEQAGPAVEGGDGRVIGEAVATAEQETDTEPTDGQKEAGNYKKGHVKIDGFDVTIEQPKGSVRSGVDASGKAWSQEMHNTYGYIRGTEGVDGDHIDVFLSDHLDDWNGMVYVVDQVNQDGSFDEHKVMYGFNSEQEARDAYLSNYEEGWTGLGAITGVTREEFKKWVDSSHRKTKPFAEYKSVKAVEESPAARSSEDGNRRTEADAIVKMLAEEFKGEIEKSASKIEIVPESAEDGPVEGVANVTVDGQSSNIWLAHGEGRTMDEYWKRVFVPFADMEYQEIADLADAYNKAKGKEVCHDDADAKRINFDNIDDAVDFEQWRAQNQEKLSKKGAKREEITKSVSKTEENLSKTSKGGKVAAEAQEDTAGITATGRKNQYGVYLEVGNTVSFYEDGVIHHGDIIDFDGNNNFTIREWISKREGKYRDIVRSSGQIPRLYGKQQKKAADVEAGGAVVDQLKNMGVDVNTDINEYRKTLSDAKKDNSDAGKIKYLKTSDGTTYGFTYRGKINLDPRKIDSELPLHEYGHLWGEAIRLINPEKWQQVVDVLKSDADTWEFLKSRRPDLKTDDEIADEMIAEFSGKNGEEKLKAELERLSQTNSDYKTKWGNIYKNIIKAIQDFWKQVGDFLNIDYKSPQQIYDQVLKDFASGMNPRARVEKFLKKRDAEFVDAVERGDMEGATHLFNEALSAEMGNGMTPFISVGSHKKGLAELARRVKRGDKAAIGEVAELMAPIIPKDAVLIPAPSHTGRATYMLDVANAIAERTGSEVADILRGPEREMQYDRKKATGKAMTADELDVTVDGEVPAGKVPVVLDNVVATGNTAEACVQALGKGIVCSLTKATDQYDHAATLKSANVVVRDSKGNVIPLSKRFDLSQGKRLGNIQFSKTEGKAEPVSEREAALRNGLIDVLRGAGIEVVTDDAEAQRELDAANTAIKAMGFADSSDAFDATRDRAVAEDGIVLPGLNEMEVEVFSVEPHDFNGDKPISQAKAWAKENLITKKDGNGNYIDRPMLIDGTPYIITVNAVKKYLSKSSVDKTGDVRLHLSVLKQLKDVIGRSIEGEIHASRLKDENDERHSNNGIIENQLVHRLYGAVEFDGKVYRVKTTIIEERDGNNRAYTYEVADTEIELAETEASTKAEPMGPPHIGTAKLLQGVEKSYDLGKKLLDESEKTTESGISEHRVWHGSGADFDAFDHSHMGEGEGAQVYGWGTYVTEVEDIGRRYAEGSAEARYKGHKADVLNHPATQGLEDAERMPAWMIIRAMKNMDFAHAVERTRAYYQKALDKSNAFKGLSDEQMMERYGGSRSDAAGWRNAHAADAEKYQRNIDAIDAMREEDFTAASRVLYSVEIPDEAEAYWLDHVARMKDQSDILEIVDNALASQGWHRQEVDSRTVFRKGESKIVLTESQIGADLYAELSEGLGSPRAASEFLYEAGLTGIKYPSNYLGGGNKMGAKNYVIFNEADAKITGKEKFFLADNGEAYGFVKDGKIYIDPRIATSETPIHEYTHLWAAALRQVNPAAWARLREAVLEQEDVLAHVKKLYPDLEGDELVEEVFAHYSGKRGAERLRREEDAEMAKADGIFNKALIKVVFDKIRRALDNFWLEARHLFGGKVDGLEKLGMDDFADMALADLLGGFNPSAEIAKQHSDPHKAAQLRLVTQSNPMLDTYHTGIRSIDDIKTYEEAVNEGEGIGSYPDFTEDDARAALESGKATVYSSQPIENGVFVSMSRMEAEEYAGGGRVYSKEVPLDDVAWIYASEGQYAPVDEGSKRVLSQMTEAELDDDYMSALSDNNETRMREIIDEMKRRRGYSDDVSYQGSLAFNGAAPARNAYFDTKEARADAFDAGDFEGDYSLGDFVDNDLDNHDLAWQMENPIAASGRDKATLESIRNLANTVKNGRRTIKMYRAVDADVVENSFRNGDWITPSREYAERHIGLQDWDGGRIIEQEVSIDDIWWNGDDINEWGYDDGNGYVYKNTGNNRKLDALITRDENGEVILPSRRFDDRNSDVRLRDALVEGGRLAITQERGRWRIEGMPGEYPSRYAAIDEWRERAAGNVVWYFSEDGNSIVVEGEGDMLEMLSPSARSSEFGERKSDRKRRERLARQQAARSEGGRRMVNELAEQLGVNVRYVDDLTDEERAQLSDRQLPSKGWYNPRTGEVFINLGRHTRLYDILSTFLHETVAHKGLRRLFGKDFNTFIDNVYNNVNKGIRAEIDRMAEQQKRRATEAQRARHDDEHWRRVATEEYMAKLAERLNLNHPEERTLWDKIRGWLIEHLRKVGVKVADSLSDNDLRGILWESYHNMQMEGVVGYAKGKAFRDQMEREAVNAGRASVHETTPSIAAESGLQYTGSLFDMLPQIGAWERMMSGMSERELFSEIAKDGPDMTSNYTEEYDKRHIKEYNDQFDRVLKDLLVRRVSADRADVMLDEAVERWNGGAYKNGDRAAVMGTMDALEQYLDDVRADGSQYADNADAGLLGEPQEPYTIQRANEIVIDFPKSHAVKEGFATFRAVDSEDVLEQVIAEKHLTDEEAEDFREKYNDPGTLGCALREGKDLIAIFTHKLKAIKDLEEANAHEAMHIAYGQLGREEHNRFNNAILNWFRSKSWGNKFIDALQAEHDTKDWADETMAYFVGHAVKKHGWKKFFSGKVNYGNEEINNFVSRIKEIIINEEEFERLQDQPDADAGRNGSRGRAERPAEGGNGGVNPPTDDDDLFRDDDFSERDRAVARDAYERMVSSGGYQFQEAVQDSMLGLKRLYQSILGKGTRIEDVAGNENAYLAENRMSSVNAAEQYEYYIRYMKPLLAAIHRLAGKDDARRDELTDYMMAKHGLERNLVLADRDAQETAAAGGNYQDAYNENRKRDYSGLTALTGEDDTAAAEAVAQQMVDDYEANHDTDELWSCVSDATHATLEKIYRSGLLSRERYERILQMFEHYIPLQGWDETTSDEVYGYLTSNSGPLGSPIRRAEGRRSKADDPIATIGLMADTAIRQGNRNRMKQTFLNFTLNHPSDAVSVNRLWLHFNDATGEWEPVFADIEADDTPDDVERKVEAFEARIEGLAANDPDHYKRGRDASGIPYKVVRGNLREHQVLIKRAGETFVLTINGNPRAAQSLNGLTNPDVAQNGIVGNLLRGAEYVNRNLSAFYTTRNPDFVISNFFRDALYSNCMAWVKESPGYAVRFHRNFARVNPIRLRKLLGKWESGTLDDNNYIERMFRQFMLNGGETGYTNVKDIEGQKRTIRAELKRQGSKPRAAWAALGSQLDLLNRSAENCARFAAFVTSREAGRSIERSIYDAKEVSVNFNKKGSGGKMVNAVGQTRLGKLGSYVGGSGRLLYVFWNAGVQGTTNFARAAKRHPGKATAGVASMFFLGALAPILAQAMGGDGDDDDQNAYYNLPEYVRRSNIIINAGQQWVAIPLPIEFRALYGLGELATGVITGNERYSNGELAFHMASQISQALPLDMLEGGGGINPFIPSLAKPVVEAYVLNKSWTGLPIYKDTPFNQQDPEWTKAYKSADRYLVSGARWLNEFSGGDDYKKGALDINPAKFEYLLSGMLGGAFTTVNKLAKMLETALGAREFDWRNMLLANRIIKTGDERTANRKLTNEYFKYKEDYESTKRLLKKYGDASDDQKYRERLDRLQQSDDYLRYDIFSNYEPVLDALHDAKDGASDAEIKEIESEENALRREMVDLLHAVDDDTNPDIDGTVDTMLKREFGRRGRTQNKAAAQIAKRMGGQDPYDSDDTEYNKVYRSRRDYFDLAEDVVLQTEAKRAKDSGDEERAKVIGAIRNGLTTIRSGKHTKTMEVPGLGEGNDDEVMENYRKARKQVLDDIKNGSAEDAYDNLKEFLIELGLRKIN